MARPPANAVNADQFATAGIVGGTAGFPPLAAGRGLGTETLLLPLARALVMPGVMVSIPPILPAELAMLPPAPGVHVGIVSEAKETQQGDETRSTQAAQERAPVRAVGNSNGNLIKAILVHADLPGEDPMVTTRRASRLISMNRSTRVARRQAEGSAQAGSTGSGIAKNVKRRYDPTGLFRSALDIMAEH